MTSSLVGSEMCIRDRGGPPSTCLRYTAWTRLRTNALEQLPAITSFSVSYTHLTLPTICSV
eukprot:6733624-Prorocentrum_lima.AAC.1